MRRKSCVGVLLAVACSLFLSGCASKATPTPADQAAALQKVVDRGYVPGHRYATTSLNETWSDGDSTLNIVLAGPSASGSYPLIVYLPGLGESAQAGVLWRNAWAKAGYMVLSVQAATAGESLFRSNMALAGNFEELARENFSPRALEARVRLVDYVLAEVKRLAASGAARYSSIDSTRVAVAGYDLGAQTASAIAGEAIGAIDGRMVEENIGAVIILSPYPGPEKGRAQRFAGISIPVLQISGTDDDDPFGIVSSAARLAPWEFMPAGDKYLLVLAGATHAMLAGSGMSPRGEGSTEGSPSSGDKAQSTNRKSKRGGAGTTGSPVTEPRLGDQADDQSQGGDSATNVKGGGRERRQPAGARSRPFDVRHIADVQGVTTAFLDGALKKDPAARKWLANDATSWIADSGSLRIK
jgi:hypothetical protein